MISQKITKALRLLLELTLSDKKHYKIKVLFNYNKLAVKALVWE